MLIVGAGGHAKEVLDILLHNYNNAVINFFDDTENAPEKMQEQFNVIHNVEGVEEYFKSDNQFILGVGEPKLRQLFFEQFINLGGQCVNIISASSISSKYSSVKGDLMHHVFVGSNATIGKGALMNTGSQVHHDAEVGEYAELSPCAVLLGKSTVGNFCRIGSHATILPNLMIGQNSIVGAGSVVTKDIPANCLAIGVPAKVIKSI
jgi:sugar O-acyltransferase (sialic acid O-acetyltransferase NeuD family)